jgi:hypothetical protein
MSSIMADSPAELPPRPKKTPRLKPGRLDFARLVAFALVDLIVLFQILAVCIHREIINDIGVFEEVDPIGIAFVSTPPRHSDFDCVLTAAISGS